MFAILKFFSLLVSIELIACNRNYSALARYALMGDRMSLRDRNYINAEKIRHSETKTLLQLLISLCSIKLSCYFETTLLHSSLAAEQ